MHGMISGGCAVLRAAYFLQGFLALFFLAAGFLVAITYSSNHGTKGFRRTIRRTFHSRIPILSAVLSIKLWFKITRYVFGMAPTLVSQSPAIPTFTVTCHSINDLAVGR